MFKMWYQSGSRNAKKTDHTAGQMRKGPAIVAAISALVGLASAIALGVILTREKSTDIGDNTQSIGVRGEDEAEEAQAALLDATGVDSDNGKVANDEKALDAAPSPSSAELRGNAPALESLASDLTSRSPNTYRWNVETPTAPTALPHPSSDTSSPLSSWHTVPLQPYSKPDVIEDDDEVEPVSLDNPEFQGPLSDFVSLSGVVRQSVSTSNSRCSTNEVFCRLVIVTDNYPWENEWKLFSNGETVASGPPQGKNYERDMKYIGNICLPTGNYRLNVKDKSGDGMCCKYGEGGVTIVCDGEMKVDMTGSASFSDKNYRFSVKTNEIVQAQAQAQGQILDRPTDRPANIRTNPPTSGPTNARTNPPTAQSQTLERPTTNRPTHVRTNPWSLTNVRTNPPTNRPTNVRTNPPTKRPTNEPTNRPIASPTHKPSDSIEAEINMNKCLNRQMYYDVEDEVEAIANSIADPEEKAHFFGGIVRLAAQ